jgi:hypothetical protein
MMARNTGPPMDVDNMRSLGVTKIDVSNLPGDLAVPHIRFRLRCSKCGQRPK